MSRFSGLLDGRKAFHYLLFKRCFNGCGLLIPKIVFEKVGFFNESMRFVLDWNLWLKFASEGYCYYVDNRVYTSNRCHGEQVTVTQKNLHKIETDITVKELFQILKKHIDVYYLKQLYYFCYATNRKEYLEIEKELKYRNVKTSCIKKCFLKLRNNTIAILKKIYKKLR